MVLILIGWLLFGQPAFEVASVKPSSPKQRFIEVLTFPGGRVTVTNFTLNQLMQEAFSVQPFQISGGPAWVDGDRFDIDARPPADSKSSHANPALTKLPMNEEQRQMLQTLLADRFQLKYHRETRQGPVYILVKTNKTLKLEEAKNKDAFPWAGGPQGSGFTGNGIAGTNATMELFASRLSPYLRRPVLDQTGMKGSFDFKFECPQDELVSSILFSIQQVGLNLEATKGPIETIVIDHAEKPSEN